jgi:hypothetical protein
MSATSDITNLLRGLQAMREKAMAAAGRGLAKAGVMVLGNAQQLCPIDTGALVNSATWTDVEIYEAGPQMVIGFNTSYAAAVHERLDQTHEIGQAKYLETAVREASESGMIARAVADEVRAALS